VYIYIRNVYLYAPRACGRAGRATTVSVGAPAWQLCACGGPAKYQKSSRLLYGNVDLSGKIGFSLEQANNLVRCVQANILAVHLGMRYWIMFAANLCLEAEKLSQSQ